MGLWFRCRAEFLGRAIVASILVAMAELAQQAAILQDHLDRFEHVLTPFFFRRASMQGHTNWFNLWLLPWLMK